MTASRGLEIKGKSWTEENSWELCNRMYGGLLNNIHNHYVHNIWITFGGQGLETSNNNYSHVINRLYSIVFTNNHPSYTLIITYISNYLTLDPPIPKYITSLSSTTLLLLTSTAPHNTHTTTLTKSKYIYYIYNIYHTYYIYIIYI